MSKIKLLVILFFSLAVSCIVPTVVVNVNFDEGCEQYLRRASITNSVEVAKESLDSAFIYLEKHNMTSGYTSVLWKSPDDNIGFWYQNLKKTYAALDSVKCSTELEKSAVLLKARQVLTNNDGAVRYTDGLTRYPNNLMFGIIRWVITLSIIGLCVIGLGEMFDWGE